MRNLSRKNRNRALFGVKLSLLLTLLVCLGLITPAFPQFPRKVRTVAAKLVAKLPFRRKPPKTKPVIAQRPNYANLSEKEQLDKPDEAAEFFRLKRLPEGETEIPVEKYLAAREQMNEMPQYATAENRFLPSRNELKLEQEREPGQIASPDALGAWTSLGPGNVGGRTRTLIVHPTTPTTMYAAGVAGGVWKTTNSGSLWTPLTDLIANLAVGTLAMDPSNPNVLYAGTGEGWGNGDGVRGAGIFKTTDGGTNWTRLANTNNANFYYVNKVVVSPVSSQRVYAATSTGIWRSTDGGTNWTQVLIQPTCDDLVARSGVGTDYLFAACRPGNQGTIYRNTDASNAGVWTSVYTEAGMARTSLALAPSNQSTIYALSASSLDGPGNNYFRGLHAVFRSTSNGDTGTWTARVRNTDPVRLNTLLLTFPQGATFQQCGIGTDFFSNLGHYANVIAVDPLDPNRVWTGGVSLFRSDDGGANWGIASCYPHPDVHAIVFHPQFNGTSNKTMFIGNDGGIEKTDDARALVKTNPCDNTCDSFATFTDLNNSYGVTQFYHGLPYPDGVTYFGGTQDNGTQRGSDSGGSNNWKFILGGDGGYVAVDPTNTSVLYAETTFLSIQKTTTGNNVSPTWVPATTGITDSSFLFLFINPFVMDPNNSQRLWTGSGKLWRTDNGAGNWSQASAALTGTVSAIAVAPTDSNYVLAGTASGNIHRTTVGTSAVSSTVWPNVQPRSGFVSGVTFDPANKNIAYATYSTFGGTHVWKSTNAGATWTGLDGTAPNNLPDIPVHCVAVDPTNSSRLYVGTDLGVFSSLDGGANWAVENTGFANVITESLAVNGGPTKYLFAFTHGRGVFRVPIGAPPNTPPTFTPVAALSRQQGSPAGAAVQIGTVADAQTPAGNLTVTQIAGGTATGITVTGITNSSGTVSAVITASCTAIAGTVRFQVSDGSLTGTGDLTVNVTANTAPTLSYGAASASAGGSTINSPATATDNGSITGYAVQSQGTYTGTISVSASGLVSISNAAPVGSHTITIRATDNCNATKDASFTLTVNNSGGGSGLQFYPLAHPVRLLDTRAGQPGCDAPGTMISGGIPRTQTAAGRTCDGLTIPANAKALTGNITTVESGGGFLTLYPSDVARPLVANSNFTANQVLNNVFTVGLGAGDGAFNIYVTTNTNVVVDITGYYAPPSASGLYFHPLPKPVRLLDTRVGQTACFTPGAQLSAGSTLTQQGTTTCDGVLIPAGAQALVGNATTVSPQASGFLTLFPANATRPLAASSNFQTGINMNAPFTVGMSPSGQFNIYTAAATNLVVDVLGYFSTQLNDANGQGLLFNSLPTPVRLLDTRTGQTGCFTPGAQMIGGTTYLQSATGVCTGIPATAKAVVGNATTINVAANGFLTFWPSNATQPNVATSNYRSGQIFNRHFTVGLGSDGAFKRFAATTTDLIVDISGYFAP